MLPIRLCFFIGIFLFSYMSYSGDCEDVFDSNSRSKWLTAEELVELAQNSKEVNNSRMFQVQYRPAVEKGEPTDIVPVSVLNERIVDSLDFSFVSPNSARQIISALDHHRTTRRDPDWDTKFIVDGESEYKFINNPILYIGELIVRSRENLLSVEGLGPRSVDTIEQALAKKGLRLGMIIPKNWTHPSSKEVPLEVLNERIFEYLDFSFATTRIRNAIKANLLSRKLIYIGELIQINQRDLLSDDYYSLSRASVTVIERALEQKGLYLGTRISEEWTRPTVDIPMEVLNARVVDYLGFNVAGNDSNVGRNNGNVRHLNDDLNSQVIKYLRENLIVYIGELIQKSRVELERERIKSQIISAIETALEEKGLRLDTTLSKEWTPPTHTQQILNEKFVDHLDFSFMSDNARKQLFRKFRANQIVYIGDVILLRVAGYNSSFWRGSYAVSNKLKQKYLFTNTQERLIKQALAQAGLLNMEVPNNWVSPDATQVSRKVLDKKVTDYLDFNSSATSENRSNVSNLEDVIKARITSSLSATGIIYIGELIVRSREDLLEIYGMDPNHVTAIEEALVQKGLNLGTKL